MQSTPLYDKKKWMYNIESIVGKILCQNQSVFRQKSTNLKTNGIAKNITHIGCTHLFYQMIKIVEETACTCLQLFKPIMVTFEKIRTK